MKANRLAVALAAAICTLSAPAFATPVTLNGSIANNTLLNGTTYQGTFNGTSVLPADYVINSLSFSFKFTDNVDTILKDPAVSTGSSAGNYQQVGTGSLRDHDLYYYTRSVLNTETVKATGQQESVNLSLAGINVGSGSTSQSKSSTVSTSTPVFTGYGAYQCDANCAASDDGDYKYYGDIVTTKTTTNLTDWTGGFEIAGTVTNKDIINQLLTTDILKFGLGVNGSVILSSAQVNMDITEKVPEPSTAMLMLAALGGLGYSMRRRSAKK